jgi:2,3-bisphosphoglycerate-independent phosphoglycerate mutase
MKKLLILIDGLGDLPCDLLKGKTPLEYADTPNLDYISLNSKLGFMFPVNEDYAPESDTAIISILGNSADISERAEFEAFGEDLDFKRGDLVLRANFGTIENIKSKKVIDRRAGRTLTTAESKKLAQTINEKVNLPVKFKFIPTVQHRGILIFYGGFSDNITNTDTYFHENGRIMVKDKFNWSKALDEEENSEFAANLVNSFLAQSYDILSNHPVNILRKKKGYLPANIILTRDPGVDMPDLIKFKKAMAIVNMPLEKGIAKTSNMDVFSCEYPSMNEGDVYENLYAGLMSMCSCAKKTLSKYSNKYNFCYIHFKEIDVPGHDNKPLEKKKLIEILDKEFFSYLKDYAKKEKVQIIITADHSTPCKLKTHTSDPVPLLVYDPNTKGDGERFSEKNCYKGSIGRIYGKQLLKKFGFY